MVKDKRIKISISARIAEEARQDKRRLDALAFACLIKINFGNSHCKYRKFTELKEFFHIGQDKLKRVIKDALEFGYILEDGKGGYSAPSLRKSGEYYYSLRFNAVKDSKERKNGSNHKITNVVSKIREVLFRNRVLQLNELSHIKGLCRKRQEDTFVPLKQYKRARVTAQRIVDDKGVSLYEMASEKNLNNIHYLNEGISIKAVALFLGCSVSTAHKIVRSVCRKKYIERHFTYTPTGIEINAHNWTFENFGKYGDTKDFGGYIRPLRREGKVKLFIQGSNRYEIKNKDFIHYAM